MATNSSILAWEISWKEEPGELQSIGLQRNWTCLDQLSICTKNKDTIWRKQGAVYLLGMHFLIPLHGIRYCAVK